MQFVEEALLRWVAIAIKEGTWPGVILSSQDGQVSLALQSSPSPLLGTTSQAHAGYKRDTSAMLARG
jgi:hypothetical protein